MEALPRCLDALARQVSPCGPTLPFGRYEILLLLNNCTDDTAGVVRTWQALHPEVALHVLECTLAAGEAHVGTARRLLMDTAWHRMRSAGAHGAAILTTDADSTVAPDWIGENLRAIERGADVVGGVVSLTASELESLPPMVRLCYRQDREYARLIAHLEHLIDPCEGDAWPRHLDHFGSSLACTPEAYAAAGGMPAVSPLEDEAFVDRVRKANLVLRHEPRVRVMTSARLDGRATVGLAGQLRLWSELPHADAHTVPSAEFLAYRFRFLRHLRQIFASRDLGDLELPTPWWRETFRDALRGSSSYPDFLGAVYCDILIRESFTGQTEEPIRLALSGLREQVRHAKPVPCDRFAGASEDLDVRSAAYETASTQGSVQ